MLKKTEQGTARGERFDFSERHQFLSEGVRYHRSVEWKTQKKQNIAEEVWQIGSAGTCEGNLESIFNPGIAC